MIYRNKKANFIKDDNGSVMLTVLIAFLLISVLIAMILSQTMMNYRMKALDRHAKDEFYYVEKSLNDVYSGVGKECAKSLGNIYSETLAKSYNYTDEALAYNKFCEEYVKDLVGLFYGTGLKTTLNGYLTDNSKTKAVVNNTGDIKMLFYKKDSATPVETPNAGDYGKYNKIVIKDIYVSSVDTSTYKSSITTDIVITVPEISFFKVNENELDYALVGCKGLVFNGNAEITGNVYGGVEKDTSSSDYYTGGIQVNKCGTTDHEVSFTSNYVVSAGDVNVNDGVLRIKNGHSTNDNEIWLENIVLGRKKDTDDSEATLLLNGDTYALNDLQVEGKNKNVTLQGNYYGYGDGKATSLNPKESYFKPASAEATNYYDTDARSKSSSIIVNSSDSVIDLSGLQNLILLGQAYIDHGSKYDAADVNSPQVANSSEAKLSMDETGMSGTIKASQEILLAPEEYLDKSNPMHMNSTTDKFTPDTTKLHQWVSDNFGSSVKLDSANPTRTVKIQKNGKVYAYCYLQFDNTNEGDREKYRSAYITKILNCDINSKSSDTEPTLQTLKKRIVAAAESQNSEILTEVKNEEGVTTTIPNVYSKNSGILSFAYDFEKNDDGTYKHDGNGNRIKEPVSPFRENDIKIVNNESDIAGYVGAIGSLSGKYKDLCTFLDYNAQFSRGVDTTDYNNKDYPFGRLWWKTGIDADTVGGTKVRDLAGCRVIIQGSNTLNLGSYLAANPMDSSLTEDGYYKLVVISTGDVVIDSDIKMKGFIFSNGKVIVNENKKLEIKSDLSVVQKRISEEVSSVRQSIPQGLSESDSEFKTIIDSKYVDGYLIRYLLKSSFDSGHQLVKYYQMNKNDIIGNRRYNVTTNSSSASNMIVNSDYTSFVQFENWRKTGAK